ncbi:MAG TPA: DEAD/DEAH box helicase family protein [Patescibacteria group bacterium]|nr:DEAD/DEAH box helicase family protein [Patescibacteria group bacterium]
MKDLKYQKKYINELVTISNVYVQDEDPKLIVFQAPTGSGKTIMLAEAMSRMVKDLSGQKELAFVWISVNALHEQSKDKLEKHFENERLLECINIGEIQNNQIEQNQIVFVNWDSLNKEGISLFMSDNEKDWNLSKVMENTRDSERDIVLIIDESHRTAKTSKSQEIVSMIGPKLTIEVSATPKEGVTNDHKITVKLSEVVAEGMIKEGIQINPGLGHVQTNEDIVHEALKKRKELKRLYEEVGTKINPLLLIQIPKRRKSDVREPEDKIIEILNKDGITIENGKLALWLAEKDKKKNLDYIDSPDSQVDVLVFKEAIAQGWDCPRATILLLQREWNAENYVFNIQTLGRIMRMPEQKHYENYPALNLGYVYTASDNFEIVEDLAKDYVSKDQMVRDNTIYQDIYLSSEHVRRKRELFRLSSEFKDCLFQAADELKFNEKKINIGKIIFKKDIGFEGQINEIDKKQAVDFQKKGIIVRDREEVCAEYTEFIRSLTYPFTGGGRPTEIIKSSLRSFFKKTFGIDNEDEIAAIVLNPINKDEFIELIEISKGKYKSLPEKADEIILNNNWQIPEMVSVFENFDEIKTIKKSVLKPYFVKRDKNEKQQWSKPEKTFIDSLEKTDNDVLWWFKNGATESKYFGIAYKKNENSHDSYYSFYPDFVIKTKKETLVVEIKDDRDFKNENLYKLNAGREYQKKYHGKEDFYFFIISPSDYYKFFIALKNQNFNNFKSQFEENLIRYTQSRKIVSEKQTEKSKEDQELLDLYEEELTKAIKNMNDKKLENEILKLDLKNAELTVNSLKEALTYLPQQASKGEDQSVKISTPFNICVLGEVADEDSIYGKLREYFAKYSIKTTDWDIDFYNNAKLRNSDILNGLKKGQSKFNLIITGQIFHHSGEGNKSANLLTELKKDKYIDHIVGCSPKELLTVNDLLEKLDQYLNEN